jgi:uracil-DNA glycosylase
VNPQEFLVALSSLKFDNVFNPYVDRCATCDMPEAPALRAAALLNILNVAVSSEIDAIWVGRDLGYRGGRRTGLALTDDVRLQALAERWNVQIARATTGNPVAERTAATIWQLLGQISPRVFLWNVFPLHPFEPGEPFSNRSHNAKERKSGEELLEQAVRMLRPKRVVAIGNDAASSAMRICGQTQVVQVRHPSYGGQAEFVFKMQQLYHIRLFPEQQSMLER